MCVLTAGGYLVPVGEYDFVAPKADSGHKQ